MAGGALPGFRDFYPEEFAQRAHIFRAWREVCRRFAFVEYDGPPLEPLELYTRKSGDEIVNQLYAFTDKGGREVALRPEMTPSFARMVSGRANTLRKPVRWFSIPQLFRYERQQRGRLKEHFQLNVDIVGESSELADAELLAVAIGCMKGLGLGPSDVRARVSDRRLLNALLGNIGAQGDQRAAVYAVIDKWGRVPNAVSMTKLQEAGLDADQVVQVAGLAAHVNVGGIRREYGQHADVARALDAVERYFDYLGGLGLASWVDLDLTIVRGLDYYTGIVFELFDAKGELRAICGGGRYDTLLRDLGGTDLPALGFGMGDVVLAELVRERGLMPITLGADADLFMVGGSGALDRGMGAALTLVHTLRDAGLSVNHALNADRYLTQAPRNQVDAAKKSGARAAIWFESSGGVVVQGLEGKLSDAPKHEFEAAPLLAGDGVAIAALRHWFDTTIPQREAR